MAKKLPRKAYRPRSLMGVAGVVDPNAVHIGDSAAGGDLAGTYPAPTLAVIGVGAGPIGDGTHVAQVTIDTKGRVTVLASVAIAYPAGGDSVEVNGVAVIDANLNDILPAPPAFGVNAKWQRTGSGPDSVSAYVDDAKRALGEWSFQGNITPPALVASVNNYNPTNLASNTVLRLSAT